MQILNALTFPFRAKISIINNHFCKVYKYLEAVTDNKFLKTLIFI